MKKNVFRQLTKPARNVTQVINSEAPAEKVKGKKNNQKSDDNG